MSACASVRRWGRGAVVSAVAVTLLGGIVIPATAVAAEEPALPETPVISGETTWQYLDDGKDPVQEGEELRSWTLPEFDDSAWKSAQGSFGAKRGELAQIGPHQPRTLLSHYDEETGDAVPTYFFRTQFTVEPGVAEQADLLTGQAWYDDGIVIWLNGHRVAGFSDERVTEESNLQYAGSGKSDPLLAELSLPAEHLQDGDNTLAVALYQDRATSSDIYFDMPSLELSQHVAPEEGENLAPTRVILTPTETPETSQSFSWLAGHLEHETGAVEIRPTSGADVQTVEATNVGTVNNNPNAHFSATVTGLQPATSYTYRVGVAGGWSQWQEFTTADPGANEFQFLYYGDAQIGLDSTWPKVVQQAEAMAPQSIGSVHAGDLIDTASNETQWRNWFAGMETSAATTNVMAAPGNHEYSGDKLMRSWKANFEYPHNNPSLTTIGEHAALAEGDSPEAQQYRAYFDHWSEFAQETVYYTDYQDVRFITLNATRDSTFLTPDHLPACSGEACPSRNLAEEWTNFQAAWLDEVLKDSPSKWNVVTFHQPVFSGSAGRDEPVLRDAWVPVFQNNNIDLVLMGHDHVYARGYVNDDVTDTEGMTSGPVYVVSNSGAKHYKLESDEKNVWTNNNATQVLRGAGVTTYQVIDVSDNQLVYRSYLAEKTSSATTDANVGDLYDTFTVTKYDSGDKWVTEAGVEPPAAPPVEEDESASVTLDRDEVTAGTSLTVTGEHFEADETLTASLRFDSGAETPLGTLHATREGEVDAELHVPVTAPTGGGVLVITRADADEITVPITVLPAAEEPVEKPGEKPGSEGQESDDSAEPLANTGSTIAPYLVAGALLMLSVGALALVKRAHRVE